MHVDLTPNVASLKKSRNKHSPMIDLFNKNKNKHIASEVLAILDSANITIRKKQYELNWYLSRKDFFRLIDLIVQIDLGTRSNPLFNYLITGYDYIHNNDLQSFRPNITNCNYITNGISVLLTNYNCFDDIRINTNDNIIIFGEKSIKVLIKLFSCLLFN